MPGIRRGFSSRIAPANVAHLGLRFDKWLPTLGDGTSAREDQRAFLKTFEQVPTALTQLYPGVVAHWKQLLTDRGAAQKEWKTRGRLAIGAGDKSVLEIGIRIHRTYGVPMIPGSAQKGLVRRWGPRCLEGAGVVNELLGRVAEGETSGLASAVIFHDALWLPDGEGPFDLDTITVHHPEYYRGNDEAPSDFDDPTPLALLSTRGTFLFAVEGEPLTAALALKLLGTALHYEGVGARTLKGYGRFEVPAGDRHPVTDSLAGLFGRVPSVPPVLAAPPLHSEDGALKVTFAPNTGQFTLTRQTGGGPSGQLRTTDLSHFPGTTDDERKAYIEQLKAKCRKKDFVVVRARFRIEGNSMVVEAVTGFA